MLIKKTFQGSIPENKIINTYSNSQTDTYSCDYLNKNFDYSTDEKIVGKWINGKPLYRKVITYTGEMTNLTTINHNISNVDLIFFENAFQYVNNSTDALCYPYPITFYGDTKGFDRVSVRVNRGNITFMADTNWGNRWTIVCILLYTKTTD